MFTVLKFTHLTEFECKMHTVFQICRHVVSTDDRNMPKSPKCLFFNVILEKAPILTTERNFHLEHWHRFEPCEKMLPAEFSVVSGIPLNYLALLCLIREVPTFLVWFSANSEFECGTLACLVRWELAGLKPLYADVSCYADLTLKRSKPKKAQWSL